MTLKKTITVSIVLHICFFSAALLLSARLFGGSGKLPETEVVFISLAADEPQAVKAAGVRVVEKAKLPVIASVEPEMTRADDVVEKAKALSEDVITEEVEPVAKEPVREELAAGVTPLPGEAVDHGGEIVVAQAVYDQPASGSHAFAPPGQGAGILPGTIELIYMAIERVKTYPIIARKRGIEGTVHVSFNVMADGTPYGIKILKSSGSGILDNATVQVVKKAAPFPLIASRIELPLTYRLRN
ncbi:gram-negative bacterial tonB protein [bacterium BMS3Abin09]|nr:gram-negative bacterial tonB protein [bacterium BMS3Abin09]GBE41362.1 gram-negative bacterial tonB protein [bacterium BMS3Bbin09]